MHRAASDLVAAHKKMRKTCNASERRDPHIVMPLCVFGCDYLYEHRYFVIDKGVVQTGAPLTHSGGEAGYLKAMIGRRVDDQWLLGQEFYFGDDG